jgi:hypothetical protein
MIDKQRNRHNYLMNHAINLRLLKPWNDSWRKGSQQTTKR